MTGIFGAIVGDIVGSSYESRKYSTKDYNFELLTDRSTITDDTVHTLAIADWILHTDQSIYAAKQCLKKWSKMFPLAGYGPMMCHWIAGTNNYEPYNSFGNGSAMRVSPVGYAFGTLEETLDKAIMSAIPTHNHTEGLKGAQAIAACIYLNRIGESKETIKEFIEKRFRYDLQPTYEEIYKDHVFDCTCQYSVPRAIITWLASTSYEDCIRKAVALGGDCDTEACIAGGICAANPQTEVPDEIIQGVIERGCRLTDICIDTINQFNDWNKTI